jgi:hypothetical protein
LCFLVLESFPFSLSHGLIRDGGGLHSRHLGGIVVVLDATSAGSFVFTINDAMARGMGNLAPCGNSVQLFVYLSEIT